MNRHVCAYTVTREYGGPEEGGWWYDVAWLIEKKRCRRRRNIKRFSKMLYEKHSHKKWGDISSVRGGQDVVIVVTNGNPLRVDPPRRPHYE